MNGSNDVGFSATHSACFWLVVGGLRRPETEGRCAGHGRFNLGEPFDQKLLQIEIDPLHDDGAVEELRTFHDVDDDAC